MRTHANCSSHVTLSPTSQNTTRVLNRSPFGCDCAVPAHVVKKLFASSSPVPADRRLAIITFFFFPLLPFLGPLRAWGLKLAGLFGHSFVILFTALENSLQKNRGLPDCADTNSAGNRAQPATTRMLALSSSTSALRIVGSACDD